MNFKSQILSTLVVLFFFTSVYAQPSRTGRTADRVVPLSQQESAERWLEFTSSKLATDFCMDFTIRHIPRRGAETLYKGTIWGTEINGVSTMRLRLSKDGNEEFGDYILKSSKNFDSITKFENGEAIKLDYSAYHKPLLDGLIYTPFDLLMQYRYWKNVEYKGADRIGQAVHYFDISAPKEFAEKFPQINVVRIALSREFNHPVQTEFFDSQKNLVKTSTLSSVKKVGDFWIARQIDLRNDITRDKDRLTFIAARLATKFENLDLIFDESKIEQQKGVDKIKPVLEEI